MRLLGIDYGTKRIGLALSDEGGTFAFPEAIIDTNKAALGILGKLVIEKEVSKIIIGESRDFKGNENPVMKEIAAFKKALEELLDIPVILWSEMLSSAHARREGSEKGVHVDSAAAALILQNYLDSLRKDVE